MQTYLNAKLVLDTHIFLWLMNGDDELSSQEKSIILKSTEEGSIAISAISLWEISMLHARQRLLFTQPYLNWIKRSLDAPGIVLCPLTPEIAVESASLPGSFHGDPADRIIVATTRILSVPLMTRDKKILNYAAESYLECINS